MPACAVAVPCKVTVGRAHLAVGGADRDEIKVGLGGGRIAGLRGSVWYCISALHAGPPTAVTGYLNFGDQLLPGWSPRYLWSYAAATAAIPPGSDVEFLVDTSMNAMRSARR